MAFITADGVLETTTTSGTGAITLAGAVTGYRAFSSVMSASNTPADTCFYAIREVDSNGTPTGNFEYGIGTYSAASTLTRTTVLGGSNGTSAVNFGSGTTKWVSISVLALELRFLPTKVLAADYTNSTTTLSTLTGMTFDAEASANYEVEIFGEIQSAATTTGIGFALTVPTGSTVSGQWAHPAATTQTTTTGWQNASATVGAKTSGVPAATTSYPVWGKFHVVTSTTTGTVTLQGASEVASSQITVKAGFVMKIRRVA